ncbi:hypothetical protein LSTR_LSTR009624 [Laodelphax striatellus]|uniref:Lipase maturation factor n=1 Tax=Laodelphax striatellus TaxID=195883 RepID=A0A482WP77_LAOST|nr:hypothetical protein LSTR_LSTR009624 [Laodelphax striatellus]
MTEIRYTRNLFLRCMNIIYLFAFTSLYVQIPGLYGNNGILPARTQLLAKDGTTLAAKMHTKPTLLWLAPYIGLDTEYMMDVLALVGIFLSFTGFISQKFCCKPIFAALWSLYYSLYQVGQTFMWFQWDVLLLEAGFLSILISPLRYKPGTRKRPTPVAPSETVTFWLVRWLVFRVLFSSGIIKLISGCPSWWGLTAMNVHFESMVLPSPLAYYCHYLPTWFLKLNVVFANYVELFLTPLFFFPLQSVRTVNFYIQLFLQVCIIITGNFNFFNFLIIALLLSLLDDGFFNNNVKPGPSRNRKIFNYIITIAVYAAVSYVTTQLYTLKLQPGGIIDSKIAFNKKEFDNALGKAFPILVSLGLISLALTSLKALYNAITTPAASIAKVGSLVSTMFYVTAAFFIFSDSLVPFSSLHPAGNSTVLPQVRQFHSKVSHLHLTNAYGLFRRMTGVGGRPEVIIEGSDNLNGPWHEYQFLYKPGNVNNSLPFVAPHQPRLDWQMWFAALGTYHQNPWLMSLAYRLLNNQPEVLSLIDRAHNPFNARPPKYVRANLYHYHYVPWNQRASKTWWTREKVGEYFPVFSKDHPPLLDYLTNMNILSPRKSTVSPVIKGILDQLRAAFTKVDPCLLLWSILTAGCAIIIVQGPTASPSARPKK